MVASLEELGLTGSEQRPATPRRPRNSSALRVIPLVTRLPAVGDPAAVTARAARAQAGLEAEDAEGLGRSLGNGPVIVTLVGLAR